LIVRDKNCDILVFSSENVYNLSVVTTSDLLINEGEKRKEINKIKRDIFLVLYSDNDLKGTGVNCACNSSNKG